MPRSRPLHQDFRGLVSLIVTMVLTMVISLIVIGFAQVTRNQQRQFADSELSTQAYYAAETGINDAYNAYVAGSITSANTGCTDLFPSSGPAGPLTGKNNLNASGSIAYTCLLVNPTPPTVSFTGFKPGDSNSFPIVPSNGSAVNSVTITWSPNTAPGGSYCTNAVGQFVPQNGAGGWTTNCPYALLQVDLVPTTAVSQANLIAGAHTFYFQPNDFGSSGVAASGSPANITGANCSTTSCSATITGLGQTQYYARVGVMYQNAPAITLCVNVYGGSGSSPDCSGVTPADDLSGAQALIDSTGRDQDELRRIQVRVSLTNGAANNGTVPGNALESTGSICKLLTVGPSVPYTEGACP